MKDKLPLWVIVPALVLAWICSMLIAVFLPLLYPFCHVRRDPSEPTWLLPVAFIGGWIAAMIIMPLLPLLFLARLVIALLER
jgi:RsiW-degrading membrane proteinase PrsW (M82 family)